MDMSILPQLCPYYFISYINYARITPSVISVITGPYRLRLREEVNYLHITSSVILTVIRHKLCPYFPIRWGNMDTFQNISFDLNQKPFNILQNSVVLLEAIVILHEIMQ